MINLLFGSTIKKAAAILIAIALAFGFFQVRGCMRAKEELRQYKQAEKIRQQDKKTDQQTKENKDEIENYDTDDDFRRGFDRLRREADR